MKKTALVLALISALLFSLVVGAQFVSLVKANGYPIWWNPIPSGSIPAKIAILSPKNHTKYSSGNLNITVHVDKPVTPSPTTFTGYSVSLFLDGIRIDSISEYIPRSEVDFNTMVHYPFIGNHELEVKATYFLNQFSISSTSTVYFTIENTPSSPSPSPTPLATSTPEPTATPFEEIGVQNTSQFMGTGVNFVVASIIVFLGLLVYFIKKR